MKRWKNSSIILLTMVLALLVRPDASLHADVIYEIDSIGSISEKDLENVFKAMVLMQASSQGLDETDEEVKTIMNDKKNFCAFAEQFLRFVLFEHNAIENGYLSQSEADSLATSLNSLFERQLIIYEFSRKKIKPRVQKNYNNDRFKECYKKHKGDLDKQFGSGANGLDKKKKWCRMIYVQTSMENELNRYVTALEKETIIDVDSKNFTIKIDGRIAVSKSEFDKQFEAFVTMMTVTQPDIRSELESDIIKEEFLNQYASFALLRNDPLVKSSFSMSYVKKMSESMSSYVIKQWALLKYLEEEVVPGIDVTSEEKKAAIKEIRKRITEMPEEEKPTEEEIQESAEQMIKVQKAQGKLPSLAKNMVRKYRIREDPSFQRQCDA